MESDDPPGQSTAQGDASTSHRRLASASAESSSSQPSRPVPSLAERLGLGAGTSPVAGPSSYSKAEDVAAAEPGTPRATPSRPIALATMSNAISNSPSRSAISPSRGSSSSEEEGMIKEEDAESEEEGEVDESDHREQPSQRERERDREHARSSSGHQYRSDRSSPRAASSSAAEQQQQQQHQPPPSSSSSSSSSVMPPARRWGQPAPTPRNDRSDAFVPPHHPPVHAHADRERDWERQREQQQRPGPSTMWPPSRYDDVRPPFAQGDRDREPRSASSSAYRQRSAHDDRSTSWSRNRRSASPIERDRRYERRGTERLPSPTVPLSGPNSIGARPPPPSYPNASLRDEGLDRQGRSWGSGPASAGPSTRWNRWSGRERERGERERDRNDFDEGRGAGSGDAWHPPPSRANDDRGERGNFRRGSDWRTMDDNFVRSRTPSLQHHQQRATAGDLAAADVWRRSPEFTRSETSQQPFARSRSSTSNLGATSSPPPPPIIRAPSPPSARGQQRATWTGGFEPPPRDAGWGGKARRNSQQSSGQPAAEPASSGEPEPTIKVEAQDDVEPPPREEAPAVQESEALAPAPRPLAAEDASTVKDYAVAEVKELAVTQESAETSSPPTVTQQESPPTSPPSLKKEIDSVPPHPPKQVEPSAADVVVEEQQPPPFSQSAAPTLPAEAQMQAPASASEAAALTVPAIADAPEVTAAIEEAPVEMQSDEQAAEVKVTPAAAELPAVEVETRAPAASADVDMPDAEAAQPPQAQPSRESESSELKAVLDEAAAVAAASSEEKPEAEAEADATADVTMKTPESGEGEQDRVGDDEQDRIDDEGASSPLPPQKTDEELEEAKRATILRLLTTGKQPDSDEVIDKLIAANQRMAQQTTFSLMESAVHGPPPPALEVKIDVYEETPETQRMRSLLTERVKATNKRLAAKTERLRRQYKALNNDWQAHCARLDRAAEARENARKAAGGSNTPQGAGAFAPSTADDSGANSQTQPSMSQPLMTPSISGRSNRRGTQSGGFGFGDAVRSEAEFLEILASLETADMQDPEARAARTATTVPDQLINPDRDALLKYEVDERNHFVANPVSYYLDEFDPDFWSQEEKVIFARKYALWPKQFGKIATALPNKTASQCVYYYYLTKHQPGHDYKAITAARNRNQKRKSRVMKPKKGRGSALMADLKSAKGDDDGGADGGDAPMSPMDARASLMGGDAAGLMPLIEEEEGGAQAAVAGATTPGGSTVKRLGEVSSSTKPKSGRGGKRVKGQGKGKGGAAAAAMAAGDMSLDSPPIRSPSGAVTPAEEAASADSDLAAAEALGALSGMMPMTAAAAKSSTGGGGGKKRKQLDGAPVTPGEDGSPSGAPPQRKPRQATSSYWSVQERGEFLKGIAIHGKDWKLVAARLNAKSAAQARNYFARNAEVPDFVEAAALGEHHAEQPLSVREQLAVEWAKEKLGVGVPTATGGIAAEGSQQPGSGHSSARPGPSPMMSKESSPEPSGMPPPPRRYGGMGIMSLLNEERPSSSSQEQRPPPPRAAPVMHEWYDNAQPPMSSQSTAPSSDREAESTDSEGFAFSSSRASPAMPHAYVPRPSYQQSHSHGSYEGRPYLPDARTRDEGPPPPLPPSSLPSLPRLSTPGGSAGGLGAPGSSLRSTYSGGGEYPASTSATVASFARPPVYNSSSVRESLPSPLSGGVSGSHHHDSLGSGRTSMPPPPTSSLGSRPYGSLHAPSQPQQQQQQRHSSWSAGHSASSASPASPLPPISSYSASSSYGDRLAPRQSQSQTSSSQQHRTLAPPPPLASRSPFSPGGAPNSTGSRSASPGGSALPPYRPSSGEAWPSMSSSSSSSTSRNLAPPSSGYHQQQRSTSYGSASSSGAPYLPRPSTSPYPPTSVSTSTGSGSVTRVSPFAPPPQSQKEHGGSPLLPPRLSHPQQQQQQQQQQHSSGGGGGGQTRPGSGHGYEEGRG